VKIELHCVDVIYKKCPLTYTPRSYNKNIKRRRDEKVVVIILILNYEYHVVIK